MSLYNDDENLPIINKSKTFKKGRNTKNKMEGPIFKNKTTKEGKSQREHQVLEPPHVVKSISNKVKRGPPERTPTLEELSPIAITHLQIMITYTR
jgi:hypothetical protein